MIVHAHITFGAEGNAQGCLLEGWSTPEMGFAWTVDRQCSVRFPHSNVGSALAVELELTPLVHPPLLPRQRLQVWAGTLLLGTTTVDRTTKLCFDVPADALDRTSALSVRLTYPDAATPASLGLSDDQRRLGFMVRAMRLLEITNVRQDLPRTLAPLRITEPSLAALDNAVRARTGLSTVDLLCDFESLGHNCEFGLMQRILDAEPLGLLRFGGIEPDALLNGLQCGFEGIGNPDGLSLESGRMNGRAEYLVRDARYGLRLHTGQFPDEVAPEALDIMRIARHLGFLQRHFAGTIHEASRIFVLHHPDLHDTARALPILNQLRACGDNTLLYVTECTTVLPGTVVQERANLFHGYIDRLVPMNEAANINFGAWVSLCANTHSVARARTSPVPQVTRARGEL